ncbi:MAG: hypothetical protein KAS97_06450 [Candidatus Aminicenantes bacterium]|nr:hypothetical protein [Candidatus Aminicenantes bacterium]
MKRSIYVFMAIFFVSWMVNAGVLSITSPTAGVGFCTGDTVNIVWHETPKDHADVKIRLFDHTVTTQILPINNSTPNDGSYNWIIPTNIPPGQYVIRVRTLDNQETDDSGIFTISNCAPPPGSIDVTKPTLNFPVNLGGTCPIEWNSTGTVAGPLKVGLFNSTGSTFIRSINNNVATNVSLNWTLPNDVNSGIYKIKVQTQDESITGVSEVFKVMMQFAPVGTMQAQMLPSPDLKISIIPIPESPAINQNTYVKFKVENLGKATPVPFKLRVYMGQTKTDQWTITDLKPGRSRYMSKKLNPRGVGYIAWTVTVDEDKFTKDSDRTNNTAVFKMIVRGPDLKITQIHTPDYKKTIQQKCKIRVTIKNVGHADSGKFEVDCNWHTCPLIAQGRKYKVCEQGLKIGESITFEFTHRYACLGMKYPDIDVNKNRTILEEDYSNNHGSTAFHLSGENIVGKDVPRTKNY